MVAGLPWKTTNKIKLSCEVVLDEPLLMHALQLSATAVLRV
jgi:hypothetical protein